MSKYETKESKEMKQELQKIDVTGAVNHIIFSIIACTFLGSLYYFFRWKIIGSLLLFFAGYGFLGVMLVVISLFIQKWGLKKIKEKEENDYFKNDDLDF